MSGGIGGNPDITAPDLVDLPCEDAPPSPGEGCCPQTGLRSARPAAGDVIAGKLYYATDTLEGFISDGSTWYPISTGFTSLESVTTLPATLSSGATTFLIEVGGGTVTLPSGTFIGRRIHIKDYLGNATADPIVVVAPIGETIDNGASVTLDSDYSLVTFIKASTTNWIAA